MYLFSCQFIGIWLISQDIRFAAKLKVTILIFRIFCLFYFLYNIQQIVLFKSTSILFILSSEVFSESHFSSRVAGSATTEISKSWADLLEAQWFKFLLHVWLVHISCVNVWLVILTKSRQNRGSVDRP